MTTATETFKSLIAEAQTRDDCEIVPGYGEATIRLFGEASIILTCEDGDKVSIALIADDDRVSAADSCSRWEWHPGDTIAEYVSERAATGNGSL